MSANPVPEWNVEEPCCTRAAPAATHFGDDDPPLGVEALHSVPAELIVGRAD
ncbi:MAG TPA: hypothetical protein VK052_14660 [Zeimonas sp.]|nr:hypothetical protein [Zeimonas sp.]